MGKVMDLRYEIDVTDITHTGPRGHSKPVSTNGPIAQRMGVAKETTKLTLEERESRVLNSLNPDMLANRDYKVTSAVPFNKIYPEGDNTAQAIMNNLKKMFTHMGQVDHILHDPAMAAEKFYEYVEFCTRERIPVSKLGLCSFYGCTRTTLEKHLNSDSEVSGVLQMAMDFIATIRTIHTDEGKIPVVQQIFEMANSHGYSRSDPKQAINIQVNTNNYSTDEQLGIINDLTDL